MELSHLPHEILLQILAHLSLTDLVYVCQVSHAFQAIGSEEYLWAQLCKRVFPLMYNYFAPKLIGNSKKRTKIRREWYSLMRDSQIAAANWRTGKHFTFAVNGSPSARVTSMLIDYESVLCGTDGEISIRSAVTGRQLPSIPFAGIPASLLCTTSSSGARRLVVGGGDGFVRLFDLQTETLVAQTAAHPFWVGQLSAHENTLVSSDGSSMAIWDLESFRLRTTQTITSEPRSSLTVADVQLIGDMPCVALAPAGGAPSIRRWDARTELWHEPVALPLHALQVMKLHDSCIAAAGQSGRIQLLKWDVNAGLVLSKKLLDQLPSHTSVGTLVMDSNKVLVSAYHRVAPTTLPSYETTGPAAAVYCYDTTRATRSWSMEQDARVTMLALDEFKCAGLIGDVVKIWNFVWG